MDLASLSIKTCRGWKLVERPIVEIAPEHFSLEQIDVPLVQDGEVLVKARYLAMEPLLRGRLIDKSSYATPVGIGEVMTGRAISEVVSSRSPEFSEGDFVENWLGWREFGVVSGTDLRKIEQGPWPISANLGALGSSGQSALLALTKLGRPNPGDTVLVTAASGAVGALVVQIAKKLGCRVIAVAGGPEKCAFVESLGADATIDYKADDVAKALPQIAPDGVDVFFDSVG
ncbi:MAG: NADP-dependent oxidoreductase, partial [Pseudomonadota bacterium]